MEKGENTKLTEKVAALVTKRCKNYDYFLRHLEGREVFWMNSVFFGTKGVRNYCETPEVRARAHKLFTMGMSLAPLLNIPNGQPYLRAFSQLILEYEHFLKVGYDSATEARKRMPQVLEVEMFPSNLSSVDHYSPAKLIYSGKSIKYERLITPPEAERLDYREVVFSFCELLSLAYKKFFGTDYEDIAMVELVRHIDEKVCTLFLKDFMNDITSVAERMLENEFRSIITF